MEIFGLFICVAVSAATCHSIPNRSTGQPLIYETANECRKVADMFNNALAQDIASGRKRLADPDNIEPYRCFTKTVPAWEPVR